MNCDKLTRTQGPALTWATSGTGTATNGASRPVARPTSPVEATGSARAIGTVPMVRPAHRARRPRSRRSRCITIGPPEEKEIARTMGAESVPVRGQGPPESRRGDPPTRDMAQGTAARRLHGPAPCGRAVVCATLRRSFLRTGGRSYGSRPSGSSFASSPDRPRPPLLRRARPAGGPGIALAGRRLLLGVRGLLRDLRRRARAPDHLAQEQASTCFAV